MLQELSLTEWSFIFYNNSNHFNGKDVFSRKFARSRSIVGGQTKKPNKGENGQTTEGEKHG